MDVQASEQPQQPLLWNREHSMNKIIIEMLVYISSYSEAREALSLEQLEAVHAVMLTTYNSMSAEIAPDDTKRLSQMHDALLQQNSQTIRVLDELSLQFFKELILMRRIGNAKPASAEKKTVQTPQISSTTGLQLQWINSRESRVSRMKNQIELQLQASNPSDQSPARVGSLQSKVQKSLPEPHVSATTSTDPPIQPGSPNQDDAEQLLQDQKHEEEKEIQASTPTFEPSPSNQDDAEQPLEAQKHEEEKIEIPAITPTSEPSPSTQDDAEQPSEAHKYALAKIETQPPTPTSEPSPPHQEQPSEAQKHELAKPTLTLKKKSQIPTPNSMRKSSQTPARTCAAAGFPSRKSAIPRPR